MARFIKVTSVTGTIIRVNVDTINMYYKNEEVREISYREVEGGEYLIHTQEGTILQVKESPENIDALLEDNTKVSITSDQKLQAAMHVAKQYNGKPL